ncbi:hypothetical protein ACJZ2D_006558 [Fusarium nematophilum]
MSANGDAVILSSNARGLANYPHARLAPSEARTLYISGTSSRRPDGSYEGVETAKDGTPVLNVEGQTAAVLRNIEAIIKEATGGRGGLQNVIDATVFLVDVQRDYAGMNAIWNKTWPEVGEAPARTTIGVRELPSPKLVVEIKYKCKEYWENVDPDVNGMLGGVLSVMPSVSRIDLQGSRTFLARLGIGVKGDRQRIPRVLEGGAGALPTTANGVGDRVGRITEGLLLKIADQVDIIEPVVKFTDALHGKPGIGHIFNTGLEGWEPVEGISYDLIWTQWCVGHLDDASLVQYFDKCKAVLNPGGIMVVKENLSTWGADKFDELDGSVTREDEKFHSLFKQAGLELVKTDMQRGFPVVGNRQLLPLRMYALRPESGARA